MPPLRVTPDTARRFMRRALLLDAPVPDIAAALAHHGYVQIDPINIAGRMHDHILRPRVAGYAEGGLMRHLHGPDGKLPAGRRTAFEHHLPTANTLVAFTLDAWPHLLAVMRSRTRRHGAWSGRSRHVWGAATQAKTALQKLFFHGRLLIARRGDANRRYYDLPERVLPPRVLAQPEPPAAETACWEILLKFRQRRLVHLKRGELPHVADLVQRLDVEGCPPLHCLKTDLPLLSEISNLKSDISDAPLLLAPLDPLIYDRRLTSALWQFDYTWEAYTPPSKRRRGYYALPVLAGTAIVGHVDPKADRPACKLRIMARAVKRGHKVSSALDQLARWLGLRR